MQSDNIGQGRIGSLISSDPDMFLLLINPFNFHNFVVVGLQETGLEFDLMLCQRADVDLKIVAGQCYLRVCLWQGDEWSPAPPWTYLLNGDQGLCDHAQQRLPVNGDPVKSLPCLRPYGRGFLTRYRNLIGRDTRRYQAVSG
ncbi:MAG: hypothetical protein JWL86_7032 [Rhizobium sp.]|nr:hypothetical protein [Rhizobium sp.]